MSIITADGGYEIDDTFGTEDAIIQRIGEENSFRMDAGY
jgi:hypothetical protein